MGYGARVGNRTLLWFALVKCCPATFKQWTDYAGRSQAENMKKKKFFIYKNHSMKLFNLSNNYKYVNLLLT